MGFLVGTLLLAKHKTAQIRDLKNKKNENMKK
jgi:hypothetical protein